MHNITLSYAAALVVLASASPLLSANNALTSDTYCNASNRGIKCSKSLSVGSLIQPSMGMALSGAC